MTNIILVVGVILSFQYANSYILLTANLEDVQTLARQLSDSPVIDQLSKIWRRASDHFNEHLTRSKYQKRTIDEIDEEGNQVENKSDTGSNIQERRRTAPHMTKADDELIALGKNASLYLKSIRKIFEMV